MLKVMKNKEIRIILKDIENQFDCGIKGEYLFLKGLKKDRVYITTPKYKDVPKEGLKINNIGLYFGTIEKDGFRLSIEGTELLDHPKKNILELSDEEFEAYMAGENLRVESEEKAYKLIKYKNKFVGSGKQSNNTLFNYVPKQRRAKEKL